MSRLVYHQIQFISRYACALMLGSVLAACDGGGAGPTPTPDGTAMPTATASSAPTANPSPAPTATPVPAPTPDVSARACFSADAYQDGAYIETSTRVLDENGDVESVKDVQVVIDADAEFRGEPAIEVNATETRASGNIVRRDYLRLLSAGDTFFELGYVQSSIPATAHYEPPVERRFDLQAGDSYEQTYWRRWTLDEGVTRPPMDPVTSEYETALTTTYVGRETVTVPAGTFETCRFDETSVISSLSDREMTETKWLAVGSGVLVRLVMQGAPPGTYRHDEELVSFSITLP
ncbi:DUF3597 domain-containing protein [Sinimarinibacterium sp. NLF-5-8]|uniref:DUF3597 domain-containing protein n=1 Tax=Sinimarinibacterium sp. NLF-5-8 TaxID=2698684 RepID=UPI00137BF35F|nr:DUF3597 domain-containing protein [Sinimarinibacterium sp. NLF-5-8]QHS09947.1 DUF3597 domain-containing protein [Sinimarinibacterium sp. NLF-5-8]